MYQAPDAKECSGWRHQGRQPMRLPRGITSGIVFAIRPRGLEFTTRTGALLIKRATDTFTHYTGKPNASCRFGIRATHGHPMRRNQHHLVIGHNATRRLALTPEKRNTKVRATSATGQARIAIRHDRKAQKPARAGTWRLFYAASCTCKATFARCTAAAARVG